MERIFSKNNIIIGICKNVSNTKLLPEPAGTPDTAATGTGETEIKVTNRLGTGAVGLSCCMVDLEEYNSNHFLGGHTRRDRD